MSTRPSVVDGVPVTAPPSGRLEQVLQAGLAAGLAKEQNDAVASTGDALQDEEAEKLKRVRAVYALVWQVMGEVKEDAKDAIASKEKLEMLEKKVEGVINECKAPGEASKELDQALQQIEEQQDYIRELRSQLSRARADNVAIGIPIDLAVLFKTFSEKSAASGFEDVSMLSKLLTSTSASASDMIELAKNSLRKAQSLEGSISKDDLKHVAGFSRLEIGQWPVNKLLKDNGNIDEIEVVPQKAMQLVEAIPSMTEDIRKIPEAVKSRWFQAPVSKVLKYIYYMMLFVVAISLIVVFVRQGATQLERVADSNVKLVQEVRRVQEFPEPPNLG